MYELRKEFRDSVDFTYINISNVAGREQAVERGLRLGTPQLLLHDGDGDLIQKWFGPVAFKEVAPTFTALIEG